MTRRCILRDANRLADDLESGTLTPAERGRAMARLEAMLRALDHMDGTRRLPRVPRGSSPFGAAMQLLAAR